MLDVKQLRVLKAVAQHGSFSAAAEALSYTQPAISQQVAALEKQAGTTLVDRTSRGVRLTEAGRALVDHAEVVLARLAAAEAELEAMAGVRGGRVRLASFPTAGASVLPPAVALFTERHPDVELSFVEREPEDAARMLRAAELEVALVFEYRELDRREFDRLYDGIELHHLIDDPMYLALPQGIRWRAGRASGSGLRRRDVDPGERRAQLVRRPAPLRLRGGRLRAEDRLPVRRLQRRSGTDRIGRGHLAAPSLALTNVREDIVVRSLGRSAPARRIAAATLAGRYRSPATDAMLGILEEVAARFELPSGAAVAAA